MKSTLLLVVFTVVLVATMGPVAAARARPSSLTRLEGRHLQARAAHGALEQGTPAPAAPAPAVKKSALSTLVSSTKKAVSNVVNRVEKDAKKIAQDVKTVGQRTIAVIRGTTSRVLKLDYDDKTVARGKRVSDQVKAALAQPNKPVPPRAGPASLVTKFTPAEAVTYAWSDPTYDIMKDWASLSYDPVANLRAWSCTNCKKPGFARLDAPVVNTYKSFFANTGLVVTTAPTSSLGKAIVIAFAGTASIGNWLTDARLTRKPASGLQANIAGQVHQGFYDTIMAHKSLLDATVAKSRACGPSCTVFVTGHSLGGALATLAAAYLVNTLPSNVHIKLYTVASPRVGDRAFADYVNRRVPDSWRAVNQEDPVPHVPFASALVTVGTAALDLSSEFGIMMEAWALFGHKGINDDLPQEFFHVSNEAWWNGRQWVYCRMPESKSCSLSLAIDLLDAKEHMIGNYPN